MDESRELARQFLEMADTQQESLPQVLGHRVTAVSHYFLGELSLARTEFETAISLYDDEQHKVSTYRFGQNPKSASMAFLAHTLHLLGYPDQAKAMASCRGASRE